MLWWISVFFGEVFQRENMKIKKGKRWNWVDPNVFCARPGRGRAAAVNVKYLESSPPALYALHVLAAVALLLQGLAVAGRLLHVGQHVSHQRLLQPLPHAVHQLLLLPAPAGRNRVNKHGSSRRGRQDGDGSSSSGEKSRQKWMNVKALTWCLRRWRWRPCRVAGPCWATPRGSSPRPQTAGRWWGQRWCAGRWRWPTGGSCPCIPGRRLREPTRRWEETRRETKWRLRRSSHSGKVTPIWDFFLYIRLMWLCGDAGRKYFICFRYRLF